jgi:hypothetical protein
MSSETFEAALRMAFWPAILSDPPVIRQIAGVGLTRSAGALARRGSPWRVRRRMRS